MDAIHRTTKRIHHRINTPRFDPSDYVIGPDGFLPAGVPGRYLNILGDLVTEMSQAEKDAVDAQSVTAARDGIAAQVDDQEDLIRAFALAVLDELNNHAATITAILDAIGGASNMSQVKSAVAAIADQPQRTIAQLRAAIRGKLGS